MRLLICVMSKLATRIDITKTPFTKYGSWISITSASGVSPLKIDNVHQIFGHDQAMMLEFTHNGQGLSHNTEATPAAITVNSHAGGIRIYMKDEDGFVVESTGPDLVFHALDSKWGKRRPRILRELPVIKESSTNKRKVIDIRHDFLAVFDVIDGTAVENSDNLMISPDKGKAVVLVRIGKTVPEGIPAIDIEADIAAVEQEWTAWLDRLPAVPAFYRAEAEAAWHVIWSSFVKAQGNLPYDTMFVNKDYMTATWLWDHCFHALGLARGNFKAAVEQLLLPFERQDEAGKMPDLWKAPDIEFWGIVKPPIHGWCLLKLMEIGEIDRDTLDWLYPRLVKWTNYWLNERDEDNDGIPNYSENGCDSGMDNSTVFDVGGKLETPDLSSYLVIQMKTLSLIARKLGKEDDAKDWDARGKELLSLIYDHFWKEDRFVCVTNGTHEYDPEPTAMLPLMPIVLGSDLDKDKFEMSVAELESRFITDYGLASEDPKSKKYEADSYWRGPTWAPAVYLIADGLNRGGRKDLARELAIRYCDMIKYQAGGYFENFDPKSGEGNRAPGFSWSAAVALLLMWEYLM